MPPSAQLWLGGKAVRQVDLRQTAESLSVGAKLPTVNRLRDLQRVLVIEGTPAQSNSSLGRSASAISTARRSRSRLAEVARIAHNVSQSRTARPSVDYYL